MGLEGSFQQPYVNSPGIGVPPYAETLTLDENNRIVTTPLDENITEEELLEQIADLLANVLWPFAL